MDIRGLETALLTLAVRALQRIAVLARTRPGPAFATGAALPLCCPAGVPLLRSLP